MQRVLARNYRNLDLLRALAVLWVLICHMALMFRPDANTERMVQGLGRFGVLLFFFHTSFVLMQSLDVSDPRSANWQLKFYLRRALRIYPLAILVILAAVLVKVPFAPWDPQWVNNRGVATVMANVLLIQNLVSRPAVIVPLWSLPAEVQMYVVLPFLYRLFASPRWKASLMVCLVAASVAAAVLFQLTHHLNVLAFVPCFFSGGLAYKLTRRQIPGWMPLGWFGLILCVSAIGVMETNVIPVEWALCFVVAFLFPRFMDMREGLIARVCHTIAKYSYGAYLTHIFALWIAFDLLKKWIPFWPMQVGLTLVMTGFASYVLFHWVEDPFIALGKWLAQRVNYWVREEDEVLR